MNVWSLLERVFGWGGVIAYHGVGDTPHSPVMHVSPSRLREQLELLRDRYAVVPLRELVDRWRGGLSTRGCVAITFDDAYAGVAVHALPVLRDLDLPATVFVASDHASRGASYWWDDVERERLAHRTGPWSEAPGIVGLSPFPAADVEAMDRVRARVITRFAGRWPRALMASSDTLWRSLDFGELNSMARDERIEFGIHTLSHPALPLLPYHEQVAEMRDSFTILRERLPRVVPVIAYPYGLYDRATARGAVEAGMLAGVTMEGRATADRPDPMVIPRIGGSEVRAPESLARHLNRALRAALIIRNRGPRPRLPVDRASSAPISNLT